MGRSIRINTKNLYVWFLLILGSILLLSTFLNNDISLYFGAAFGSIVLLWVIVFIILNNEIYMFNPLFMFSVMYMTAPITMLYSLATKFENNKYIRYRADDRHFVSLLNMTVLMFLVGYLLFVLGYSIRKRIKTKRKKLNILSMFDNTAYNKAVFILILLFFIIACVNFIYVIMVTSGGNFIQYMTYMAVRSYVYNVRVSTLGYNFGYMSVYIYALVMDRTKRNSKIYFSIMLMIMILIRISTGRIFQTLAFIMTVMALLYTYDDGNIEKKNRRYIVMGAGLAGMAILFYIMRAITSFMYQGMGNDISIMFNQLLQEIGHYLFGRGNTVNIVVVTKILDSWGDDIGFLYGKSLLSSLVSINDNLSEVFPMTSSLIKNSWFGAGGSGLIPPTCIGELYANFGYIGILAGMFLTGYFFCGLYSWYLDHYKNDFVKLVYFQVLFGFVFIFPKTDFSNIPLFEIGFTLFTFIIVKFLFSKKLMLERKY